MQLKTPSRPSSKKTIITTGIMACLATGWSILSAGNAQAFAVTWNGANYDVTTFTGSRDSNAAKFGISGGLMPWWGSQADAASFMQATATSEADLFTNLGVPSTGNVIIFGYNDGTMMGQPATFGLEWTPYTNFNAFSIAVNSRATNASPLFADTGSAFNWVQATPVSVPGPLPILGIGAALGFSRKLKKRIANRKSSTTD